MYRRDASLSSGVKIMSLQRKSSRLSKHFSVFLWTNNQEAEHIADGVYQPSWILSREDGGGLITEGVDNLDINTQTIDGKETFHSLA